MSSRFSRASASHGKQCVRSFFTTKALAPPATIFFPLRTPVVRPFHTPVTHLREQCGVRGLSRTSTRIWRNPPTTFGFRLQLRFRVPVYIELYYIFASVWGHKVYTIYSILFIVFIILLVVTASSPSRCCPSSSPWRDSRW